MSVNKVLAELETYSPEDLKLVQERLTQLQAINHDEETPEMLAAIDEGLRSLREEGSIPIEVVEERMKSWNFKSS